MAKGIETTTGDLTPPQPTGQEKLEFSDLVPADELTDLVKEKMVECADAGYTKSINEEGQKYTIAILSGVVKGKEVRFAISEWERGGVSVMLTYGANYIHYTAGVHESLNERVVLYRGADDAKSQPLSRGSMDTMKDLVSEATPLSPQM